MSKTVFVANYLINNDLIVKNLCENRSRPELHCEGKCVLIKQVKAESNNFNYLKIPKEFSDWIYNELAFEILLLLKSVTIDHYFQTINIIKGHYSIFHPPPLNNLYA